VKQQGETQRLTYWLRPAFFHTQEDPRREASDIKTRVKCCSHNLSWDESVLGTQESRGKRESSRLWEYGGFIIEPYLLNHSSNSQAFRGKDENFLSI
jgi:hypothetical protein